jgi:hypothetical protein
MIYFSQLLYLGLLAHVTAFCNGKHSEYPARYQEIPSLRDQAKIEQSWRDQRIASIPDLLRKYQADAWLVRLVFRTLSTSRLC